MSGVQAAHETALERIPRTSEEYWTYVIAGSSIAQILNPKPDQKAETLPSPLSEVVYGEPVVWILP
jgi:hypothetical protein